MQDENPAQEILEQLKRLNKQCGGPLMLVVDNAEDSVAGEGQEKQKRLAAGRVSKPGFADFIRMVML